MYIKEIIKAIYLNLYQYGYKEISLKNKDINKYVESFKELFDKYELNTNDLFVKEPVQETYSKYKNYLLDIFLNSDIGYIGRDYETININCNSYYINKILEDNLPYQDLIIECRNAFIKSMSEGIEVLNLQDKNNYLIKKRIKK